MAVFGLTRAPWATYKPPLSRVALAPRACSWSFYREAYLSTVKDRPQAPARIPRPHGDGGWPQGDRQSSLQGPEAALGLSYNGGQSGTPQAPG